MVAGYFPTQNLLSTINMAGDVIKAFTKCCLYFDCAAQHALDPTVVPNCT